MAQFNRKLNRAEKHFDKAAKLREAGLKSVPYEAHKTDHHRVDDAWRQRKSKTIWRGAKGRSKLRRGPSSPRI